MRKALLIAAQERMDKLSGKGTENVAGSSANIAPASKVTSSKSKDDDDLVILQEVSTLAANVGQYSDLHY